MSVSIFKHARSCCFYLFRKNQYNLQCQINIYSLLHHLLKLVMDTQPVKERYVLAAASAEPDKLLLLYVVLVNQDP